MKSQDASGTALQHFLRHEHDIQRFLQNQLHCHSTSQDLTQETWLRFSRMRNTEHIADIKAFLIRIASNLALDYLRHRQVEQRSQQQLSPPDSTADTPSTERVVSARQQCSQLQNAIAELPVQCRVAFTLHRLKGKSYREIAQILNISEKAVEKHISRALRHCRQRVQPQ